LEREGNGGVQNIIRTNIFHENLICRAYEKLISKTSANKAKLNLHAFVLRWSISLVSKKITLDWP